MEEKQQPRPRLSRSEAAAFVDSAVSSNTFSFYLISRAPLNIMLAFFAYLLGKKLMQNHSLLPEVALIIPITLAIFLVYPEYRSRRTLIISTLAAFAVLCIPAMYDYVFLFPQLIVAMIVLFRPLKRIVKSTNSNPNISGQIK